MLNILVQLLVCSSSFRGVQVTTTYDVAVGRIEVERVRNIVKFANREVLGGRLAAEGHILGERMKPLCLVGNVPS